MRSFDVIVIGAGPAGEVAAGRLGEAGREVALVERELIGGECSFFACMPSKALLRPGELLDEVRRVPGAREAITGSLEVTAALHRRDEIVHHLDDSSQIGWLEDRNVTIVRGNARVTGERVVAVEGEDSLQAREAIVLASGSTALIPPIAGLKEAHPWTNRQVTTTKHVPPSLVILGGGVVGVEMAQAYSTFGTHVSLIEGEQRLIPHEEPFAAEQLAEALRERGVQLHLGSKAEKVVREAGEVAVTLEDGALVAGEELLVAIGRQPNTQAVEPLGYEPGKPVEVDEHYRSRRFEWLFAIGDVNGVAQLTHMGKYQARVVTDLITGRRTAVQQASNGVRSPRVIFTDPGVAAVGHTEASAKDAGLSVRVVEVATSGNAGGSFYGHDAAGSARIVIDEERGVIAGATVTGAEVSEFLHPFTIAVTCELTLEQLWHAVPPFPTRSELWLRLLEKAGL